MHDSTGKYVPHYRDERGDGRGLDKVSTYISKLKESALDNEQPPSLGVKVLQFTMQIMWVPLLLLGHVIHRYVHPLSDLGSDIIAGCDQVSFLT